MTTNFGQPIGGTVDDTRSTLFKNLTDEIISILSLEFCNVSADEQAIRVWQCETDGGTSNEIGRAVLAEGYSKIFSFTDRQINPGARLEASATSRNSVSWRVNLR